MLNNPSGIALAEVENIIHHKLIDGTWFYADKWNLPDLHFGTWDNELDHTWHEFESIEFTDEVGKDDFFHFSNAKFANLSASLFKCRSTLLYVTSPI